MGTTSNQHSGLRVALAVGLFVVAVTGCSSGSGEADGPDAFDFDNSESTDADSKAHPDVNFGSEVSKDDKIEDLDPEQVEEVCEDGTEWAQNQFERAEICLFSAHLGVAFRNVTNDSEARELCQQSKQQCEANFETGDDACQEVSATNCEATVGTLEQCYASRVRDLESALDTLPACSDVTASFYDDFSAEAFLPDPSGACKRLREKCPDLYRNTIGEP